MDKQQYHVRIPKYMWNVDKDWNIVHSDERFIECLFKTVCGYHLGHTFTNFMIELGFAKITPWRDDEGIMYENIEATDFGKKFIFEEI